MNGLFFVGVTNSSIHFKAAIADLPNFGPRLDCMAWVDTSGDILIEFEESSKGGVTPRSHNQPQFIKWSFGKMARITGGVPCFTLAAAEVEQFEPGNRLRLRVLKSRLQPPIARGKRKKMLETPPAELSPLPQSEGSVPILGRDLSPDNPQSSDEVAIWNAVLHLNRIKDRMGNQLALRVNEAGKIEYACFKWNTA